VAALRVSKVPKCHGVDQRCLPGDILDSIVCATRANGLAFAVDRVVWRRVIDAAGRRGHAQSQADAVALIGLVALML
jgi:hypothetical protein